MLPVVLSEFRKAVSVRSTGVVVAVAFGWLLAVLGIELYGVILYDGLDASSRSGFGLSRGDEIAPFGFQICLVVFAILTFTNEHTYGTFGQTLAATPSRGRVLAAKALVVTGFALAVGVIGQLVVVWGSFALVGDRPIPGIEGPVLDELPMALLWVLPIVTVPLAGVAVAVLARSTAVAITVTLVVLAVVPRFVTALPEPWNARVGMFLPEDLTTQLHGGLPFAVDFDGVDPGLALSQTAAGAILVAYALVGLATAYAVIRRRDT